MTPITIFYATKSPYKKGELEVIEKQISVSDHSGVHRKIGEVCKFETTPVATDEPLEIDLIAMVRHKVKSAYRQLLMPCIVEHAGLILHDDSSSSSSSSSSDFPGGLTQPMWDSLAADGFLKRTGSAGERATARAVIGYCNGAEVLTFVGETQGTIADAPRGARTFYWDTIFCPDEFGGLTYAEVSAQADGLQKKVHVSQSTKALQAFVEHVAMNGTGALFAG